MMRCQGVAVVVTAEITENNVDIVENNTWLDWRRRVERLKLTMSR